MNIKSLKFQDGEITIVPETVDDLYLLYNIILPDDKIKARTSRRIRQEDEERSDKGERISMILTLLVEDVQFHEFAVRLRVKGKIMEGPEDLVSFGTYHTINIEIGTLVTILKDNWPKVDRDRIIEAEKKTSSAKVLVVTIDDSEATIAAVGAFSSNILVNFKERIPKKAGGKEKIRTEMINKFFNTITFAIEEAISTNLQEVTAMVLAGPGFTKDDYLRFLKEKKSMINVPINRIILETASCGGPSAIGEIISKNILGRIIEEEQASVEAVLLEEVMTRLGKNTGTVAYGKESIEKAIEFGAVDTLLIVDNQLRLRDKGKRRLLDEKLKAVQKSAGKIVIMSEQHQAGKQVEKFGGMIALLRYPIT